MSEKAKNVYVPLYELKATFKNNEDGLITTIAIKYENAEFALSMLESLINSCSGMEHIIRTKVV